jgi:hypothetical protein
MWHGHEWCSKLSYLPHRGEKSVFSRACYRPCHQGGENRLLLISEFEKMDLVDPVLNPSFEAASCLTGRPFQDAASHILAHTRSRISGFGYILISQIAVLDFGVEVRHFKGAARVISVDPLGQETIILKKRKLRFADRFPIGADTGKMYRHARVDQRVQIF